MTAILLIVVLFVLLAALRGLVTWLIVGELKGQFSDHLVARVKAAVLELPRDQREDLEEEWLAELQALLDRPRKAIAFSRGLATAARGIAHESAPDSRPISERAPTFNAEAIAAYKKRAVHLGAVGWRRVARVANGRGRLPPLLRGAAGMVSR